MTAPEQDYSDVIALREELLGPSRTRELTAEEMREVGRVFYGSAAKMSLYGLSAAGMAAKGLRLLGRTAVECTVDPYAVPVAEAVARLTEGPSRQGAFVADLFCGSGNVGHHLGRRLGLPVHAAELDPDVHAVTHGNLAAAGSPVELEHGDYRDMLTRLGARGDDDVYVVEPPWGEAIDEAGLDLFRTTPPVPEILDGILASRGGRTCLCVIKTTTDIARDSLARSFAGSAHLDTVVPDLSRPPEARLVFHLHRLGSADAAPAARR
ncbi:class I SAM-dependent methyltransferase [Streptomyces sp. HNM0574]|uniref:class I SAM-dependent methyltransferase n=1 Tax=Streptomyces sp. HNM0574 TaxID=2714954 RepID=UPI001469D753|nr:class I SAM-dependent methyltransferase [Streptomyces sp. HNM0574]NLU68356.1 hypothetical protein [Streptomyces sp. HNM0574]